VRALEDLAVKVDGGLEPGRVIGTFPNARVRRQVEAAPLGQSTEKGDGVSERKLRKSSEPSK